MRYETSEFTLANGRRFILRPLGPDDAEAMLAFLKAVSEQSPFMIRYPDEIGFTTEQEEELLRQRREDPFLVDLAVFTVQGELIANCCVHRLAETYRMAHRAELSIAVRKEYWHQGLGTLLTGRAIQAAGAMPGIESLELTAMGKNRRALALYERQGFQKTGELKRGFRYRDGSYDSEIQMQRML